MQRESWSIGLACGLGALIGSLVGLESVSYFDMHLKWWYAAFGMLVGGGIAYVVIDFRHFHAGIARAYRETLAWRSNAFAWKGFGYGMLMYLMVLGTICFYAAVVAVCIWPADWQTVIALSGACYPVGLLMFGIPTLTSNFAKDDPWVQEIWFSAQKSAAHFAVCSLNPIAAPFWLGRQLFEALRWICLTAIPFIAVEGAYFLKQAFIYIHSTRRTICFVDAAIGAGVGFAYGNAVVGAIVGGMLGVINYELVAVWWLKLPVRR